MSALAWRSVDGSFSHSRSALVTDPYQSALASSMSAKSAYLYLLSAHFAPPHCEEKFFPSMARCIRLLRGDNFISALWTDLLLTLPGKSRTASFIPLIALSHLVMLATLTAFVVPLRLPLTCSLIVLWLRASLVGFNLSCFYPVSCFVVSSCPFWFLFL